MKWLWISGWAVPPAWLAGQARTAMPAHEHRAVSPAQAAPALAASDFDAVGAYSLGTLWLLRHAHLFSVKTPVTLLAPIFAFAAEQNCGGRIPLAQLRLQRRHLRRDPSAALAEFFRLSGVEEVNFPPTSSELIPAGLAELDEGLDWLENWQATPPPPPGWRGFVGENDPLLDANQLHSVWPGLRIVPGADHRLAPLLQAAAQL